MSCEFCGDPAADPVILDSPDGGEVKVALCSEHRDELRDLVVEPVHPTS